MQNIRLIPIKKVTKELKTALKEDGNYDDNYWAIFARVLTSDGVSVGTDHYVEEIQLNQPYKFEIKKIVENGKLVDRALRGNIVILICRAKAFTTTKETEKIKEKNLIRDQNYKGQLSLIDK